MEQNSVHRNLAAVLAAERVDSGHLFDDTPAGTPHRFSVHLREIWHPRLASHHGRIVKETGDRVLATFPSVVDAVECALALQNSTEAWNTGKPDEDRIAFRIGVELDRAAMGGEGLDDDFRVGTRLESLASPGSVCVSGAVYDAVHHMFGGEFIFLGDRHLDDSVVPTPVWQWHGAAADVAREQPSPAQPATPLARLHVLGDFRLELADGQDATPPGPKSQALVAYLALTTSGRASREVLATLLWGRSSDEQARGSLRQSLMKIRSGLGAAAEQILIAGRSEIQIDRSRLWVDAIELERYSAAPDFDDMASFRSLYAGELLANLKIREDGFTDWLLIERTRLRDVAIAAWADLLSRANAARADVHITAAARGLLAIDRTHEQAHRALMRIAADRGDQAGALRQYEACRDALSRDLDIEPSEATEQLRASIVKGGYSDHYPGSRNETEEPAPMASPTPGGDRPSIAVLPFRSIGDDERYQYLREGLADDLITSLSKFREVLVIARASSFVFNQPHADSRHIARRLGVRYVLEGSLRIVGDDLRINAQLVDGASGGHIWADRYDVPTSQTIELMDELVSRIIGTLLPVVESTLTEISRRKLPQNMAAYDYYLRGKHLVHNVTGYEDARNALELLEKAISIDPNLTIAYGHLVRICNTSFLSTRAGSDQKRYQERAFELAEKALALDPADPHSHISMGWCHLRRRNFGRAKMFFERALTLNPYDADRITDTATGLMYLGEHDRAIDIVKRAMTVNPNHPESYLADLAELYFMKREYTDAISLFETVSDRPPKRAAWKAATYAQMGHVEEAHGAVEEFCRQVRAIWAGPGNAGPAEFVAWSLSQAPFKSRQDYDHLVSGLRKAGLPA